MAIDFPSSPTTGQTFTAGAASWSWDGVKWVSSPAGWTEAPLDGKLYDRQSGTWAVDPVQSDAPDGSLYARSLGGWSSTGTFTGPLTFNGATTFGSTVTLNANPTTALQAATKQYVDTKAPIANPTFTGTVTIPAGASISGYATTASVNASLGSYLPLAGGTVTGNLTVNGQAQTVGAAIHNTTTYFNYGSITDMVAAWNGTLAYFQYQANYWHGVTRSNGIWQLYLGGNALQCSPGGHLTAYGNLQVNGTSGFSGSVNANGIACTSLNDSGGMNVGSTGIQYTNYYPGHTIAFGWAGGAAGLGAWVDGSFVAWIGGGSSDARMKDIEEDYTDGLESIVKLNPVRFRWKGNFTSDPDGNSIQDVNETYIGVVAQDVEQIFPQAVIKMPGYLDHKKVDDVRTLDATKLIYPLINALKEVNARLSALENRDPRT